jgi:DNA-binding NtrC family response regulator
MSAKTVLLIDDEETPRWALASWLIGRGLSIATAASGEEALGIVKNDPDIAVVVLDINMPGLNGMETLAAIKAMRPDMEAVIVTGHPTVEYALEGRRLGVLEYLAKPCDIHVLFRTIRQAMGRAVTRTCSWDGAVTDQGREARA